MSSVVAPESAVSRWIAADYRSPAFFADVREALGRTPPRAIGLTGFLAERRARTLAAVLRSVSSWHIVNALFDEFPRYSEVDDAEWHAASLERKFFRHSMARPLSATISDPRLRPLLHFYNFVTSPDFFEWVAAVAGVDRIAECGIEIASYERGDEILPHTDAKSKRVLGMNLYLDEAWQSGDGGELLFEHASGERSIVAPSFNVLSLMPFSLEATHRVLPFTAPRRGRYTIVILFSVP